MEVGEFRFDSSFTPLLFSDKLDKQEFKKNFKDKIRLFSNSINHEWKPFLVKFGTEKKRGDIMDLVPFVSNFVINKKAREVIGNVLGKEKVEFLPLMHPREELYVLNILNCLNIECVDISKTQKVNYYYYLDESGKPTKKIRAIELKHPVFKKNKVENEYLFTIPKVSGIFFSSKFKDLCEDKGIKGLVWGMLSYKVV